MPSWNQILDAMAARTAPIPPHVTALHLPRIDGWEPGRVWCTWTVDPTVIQPHGAVFGGYITAVADEMLGLATGSVLKEGTTFVTTESRANYFKAIRGGELTVEARVIHQGRSSVYVEATFTNDKGNLAAKASVTQTLRQE